MFITSLNLMQVEIIILKQCFSEVCCGLNGIRSKYLIVCLKTESFLQAHPLAVWHWNIYQTWNTYCTKLCYVVLI